MDTLRSTLLAEVGEESRRRQETLRDRDGGLQGDDVIG